LSHEILCQCLSQIELAVGGGGFAFTRLDCSNKELTSLGNKVENYKQLRHVILSSNKLDDIKQVTKLPHLLSLQCDNNQVNQLECMSTAEMPWCQKLDLTANQLTSLPSIASLSRLRLAIFADNQITSVENFGGHSSLEELQLQGNQLESLKGLGELIQLKKLVLTGNKLTSFEGLNVPMLTNLVADGNQLTSLAGVGGAPMCNTLDIKGNQLAAEDEGKGPQAELQRLGADCPELRTLLLEGNAMVDGLGENLRAEMFICAPQITKVDEAEITDEDREASKARMEDLRVKMEEAAAAAAEAKAAEEAAAAEAAAAAAAAAEEG